jgi:hypothetical protein
MASSHFGDKVAVLTLHTRIGRGHIEMCSDCMASVPTDFQSWRKITRVETPTACWGCSSRAGEGADSSLADVGQVLVD